MCASIDYSTKEFRVQRVIMPPLIYFMLFPLLLVFPLSFYPMKCNYLKSSTSCSEGCAYRRRVPLQVKRSRMHDSFNKRIADREMEQCNKKCHSVGRGLVVSF